MPTITHSDFMGGIQNPSRWVGCNRLVTLHLLDALKIFYLELLFCIWGDKCKRPNSLTLVLKWMSLVYNTLHCCWILMLRIAAAWNVHCSGMWCSVDLNTSQHCITLQKSRDFIYTVAKASKHALYRILSIFNWFAF